jgi:hypothetical protein
VWDDVEVLDFCGPFEVFSVANRFTDQPAFIVLTVAGKAGPVLTRGLSQRQAPPRLARRQDGHFGSAESLPARSRRADRAASGTKQGLHPGNQDSGRSQRHYDLAV